MVTAMNRFDSWEAELYHHGIKGQKWGVRRYQNPDGSLTEAGKQRVASDNRAGYLNPNFEDKGTIRAANRDKIAKKYAKAYWRNVRKGMDENAPTKAGRKIWDKYKDAYAKAILKDLGLENKKRGRDAVKEILQRIDPDYKYDRIHAS